MRVTSPHEKLPKYVSLGNAVEIYEKYLKTQPNHYTEYHLRMKTFLTSETQQELCKLYTSAGWKNAKVSVIDDTTILSLYR